MTYKELISQARSQGITSEKKMLESINQLSIDLASLSSMSCELSHEVTRILRNQHAILYDRHYSEKFANHDINNICYLDSKGEERHGYHWTRAEVVESTKDMKFHSKVNDWDKYVAFNAMYADLCAKMTDAEIIRAAYLFYFCDRDWQPKEDDCTKIWDYMSSH